eukprot:g5265.t1
MGESARPAFGELLQRLLDVEKQDVHVDDEPSLPLSAFDSSDFWERSPEQWIALSVTSAAANSKRPKGKTRDRKQEVVPKNQNQPQQRRFLKASALYGGRFRRCAVVDYEQSQEKFKLWFPLEELDLRGPTAEEIAACSEKERKEREAAAAAGAEMSFSEKMTAIFNSVNDSSTATTPAAALKGAPSSSSTRRGTILAGGAPVVAPSDEDAEMLAIYRATLLAQSEVEAVDDGEEEVFAGSSCKSSKEGKIFCSGSGSEFEPHEVKNKNESDEFIENATAAFEQQTLHLHPLFVCFDGEDPFNFVSRFCHAVFLKLQAEDQCRAAFCIDHIPTDPWAEALQPLFDRVLKFVFDRTMCALVFERCALPNVDPSNDLDGLEAAAAEEKNRQAIHNHTHPRPANGEAVVEQNGPSLSLRDVLFSGVAASRVCRASNAGKMRSDRDGAWHAKVVADSLTWFNEDFHCLDLEDEDDQDGYPRDASCSFAELENEDEQQNGSADKTILEELLHDSTVRAILDDTRPRSPAREEVRSRAASPKLGVADGLGVTKEQSSRPSDAIPPKSDQWPHVVEMNDEEQVLALSELPPVAQLPEFSLSMHGVDAVLGCFDTDFTTSSPLTRLRRFASLLASSSPVAVPGTGVALSSPASASASTAPSLPLPTIPYYHPDLLPVDPFSDFARDHYLNRYELLLAQLRQTHWCMKKLKKQLLVKGVLFTKEEVFRLLTDFWLETEEVLYASPIGAGFPSGGSFDRGGGKMPAILGTVRLQQHAGRKAGGKKTRADVNKKPLLMRDRVDEEGKKEAAAGEGAANLWTTSMCLFALVRPQVDEMFFALESGGCGAAQGADNCRNIIENDSEHQEEAHADYVRMHQSVLSERRNRVQLEKLTLTMKEGDLDALTKPELVTKSAAKSSTPPPPTPAHRPEQFLHLQKSYAAQVGKLLRQAWTERVSTVIEEQLRKVGKGWFQISAAQNEFSKARRVLRVLRYMMQDSVAGILAESLMRYKTMLEASFRPSGGVAAEDSAVALHARMANEKVRASRRGLEMAGEDQNDGDAEVVLHGLQDGDPKISTRSQDAFHYDDATGRILQSRARLLHLPPLAEDGQNVKSMILLEVRLSSLPASEPRSAGASSSSCSAPFHLTFSHPLDAVFALLTDEIPNLAFAELQQIPLVQLGLGEQLGDGTTTKSSTSRDSGAQPPASGTADRYLDVPPITLPWVCQTKALLRKKLERELIPEMEALLRFLEEHASANIDPSFLAVLGNGAVAKALLQQAQIDGGGGGQTPGGGFAGGVKKRAAAPLQNNTTSTWKTGMDQPHLLGEHLIGIELYVPPGTKTSTSSGGSPPASPGGTAAGPVRHSTQEDFVFEPIPQAILDDEQKLLQRADQYAHNIRVFRERRRKATQFLPSDEGGGGGGQQLQHAVSISKMCQQAVHVCNFFTVSVQELKGQLVLKYDQYERKNAELVLDVFRRVAGNVLKTYDRYHEKLDLVPESVEELVALRQWIVYEREPPKLDGVKRLFALITEPDVSVAKKRGGGPREVMVGGGKHSGKRKEGGGQLQLHRYDFELFCRVLRAEKDLMVKMREVDQREGLFLDKLEKEGEQFVEDLVELEDIIQNFCTKPILPTTATGRPGETEKEKDAGAGDESQGDRDADAKKSVGAALEPVSPSVSSTSPSGKLKGSATSKVAVAKRVAAAKPAPKVKRPQQQPPAGSPLKMEDLTESELADIAKNAFLVTERLEQSQKELRQLQVREKLLGFVPQGKEERSKLQDIVAEWQPYRVFWQIASDWRKRKEGLWYCFMKKM